MSKYNTFKTDILVIGGGIAALFAAIKARETGVDVTVVDKGHAGRSGQSPYADGFTFVRPENDAKKAVERVNKLGEYLNHREWCEICFRESYDRFNDLVDMGVEFFKDEVSNSLRFIPHGEIDTVNIKGIKSMPTIRKYAEKTGVNFIDRVMITDLVKGSDDRVIGAVGITTRETELRIFNAKATILCTGATAYKPPGWPAHGLTGDGDAMAYRLGARITGKEFVDMHHNFEDNPMYSNFKGKFSKPKARPPIVSVKGADGKEIQDIGTLYLNNDFEIHKGNGPITATMEDGSTRTINGGISNGMSIHKGEGVWAVSTKCETDLKGLYAAGDVLANRQAGGVYPGGMALAGSASTGARAGKYSAEFSGEVDLEEIDGSCIEEIRHRVFGPLERQGGYNPRFVINSLQNLMRPYYVSTIKEGKRLKAVLTLVEFLRDHTAPMIKANDDHELVLALEVKNMLLNAEMRLKASLFRKESRGTHYREDYPERDDDNFLVWITMQNVNGKMVLDKVPVPEEWRPDPDMSYDEKYLTRLPKF